jgi:Holliday junction resolvase RusA-like endonuclease
VKRFELLIILSENHTRIDLDNGLKALIDYLRKIELIEDDSPKHMRRLVVEFGLAPFGCRVTVKPCL